MPGLPVNKVRRTSEGAWQPLLVRGGRALPLGEHQSEAEAEVCYDLGKMLVRAPEAGFASRMSRQGPAEGVAGSADGSSASAGQLPTMPLHFCPTAHTALPPGPSVPAVTRRAAGCA